MTPEEYLDSLLQSLENNTTTNEASPLVKKVFKDVFGEVRANKPGFSKICEKQGITPFKQE